MSGRPLGPTTTLGQAVAIMSAAFAASGFETPDLDAKFLALHALRLPDHDFYAARENRLGSACAALFEAMRRRLAREPVSRILGEWEFWSLPIGLNAATLVPRPDTETVVEAALARIDAAGRRGDGLRILDIGTGSGAILIALLSELPNAFGIGADLSVEAIAMARENARRNKVHDRAAFVVGNWAHAMARRFDLVVSNPPYIPSGIIGPDATSSWEGAPGDHELALFAGLDAEVRDHDPRLALDGGADGLDAYRAIAKNLIDLLNPSGFAVLELGVGQGSAVAALLLEAGLGNLRTRPDLAGIERALIVWND